MGQTLTNKFGIFTKSQKYEKYEDEEFILSQSKNNVSQQHEPQIQETAPNKEASLLSGTSNLTNTILGAGMLGLPFALASSGIIVGALLFLIASMATIFGLHLLSVAAHETVYGNNKSSYFSVAQMTFPKAAIVIDLAVAIKCFGVAISYLLVIGSLMPDAMSTIISDTNTDLSIFLNRSFWLGISIIFCVPVSLLKNIDSLRFTSYIALGSVAYVLALVLYFFLTSEKRISWDNLTLFPDSMQEFFVNIPIFVFAFTCHQNLFSIRNDIPDNNRISLVILTSVLLSLFVYVVIGYCGYFTFGAVIKDNLINNFPKDSIEVTICRLAVSILVAFSYPLQIHPCRTSLLNLLGIVIPSTLESNIIIYIMTLFLCTCTYIVAFFLDNLGIVFSIVGATGSVTLCYILPGSFYVKLYWNDKWLFKKFFAFLLAFVGIGLMGNSLFWIINSSI